LINTIKKRRITTIVDTLNKEVPELAEKLGIEHDLPTKRRKRVKLDHEESRDESFHFTANQFYKIQINEVFGALIAHLN
jgi:intein/homing endonuclease